jgi:hypothetical protein
MDPPFGADHSLSIKDIAVVLAPFGATLVGVLALIVSAMMTSRTLRVSTENSDASIWQKANELEIKEVQEKLDRFYGPFIQMSETNALLARDLRHRQPDSQSFLLIEKLFDRDWLKSLPCGERALVDEVVSNAVNLRKFIIENARMMDQKVQPYLSRVNAHYRILELAHLGKLGTDPTLFVQKYVFPIQIGGILQLEVARLESRKELLRSQPSRQPPPMAELVIPASLSLKEIPYPRREHRDELNVPIQE